MTIESQHWFEALKGEINKTISYDVDITRWKQQIYDLQSKIKQAEAKKFEINGLNLAKLDEEGKVVIQHIDNVIKMDMEIKTLTATTQMTDIHLSEAKAHFQRLK